MVQDKVMAKVACIHAPFTATPRRATRRWIRRNVVSSSNKCAGLGPLSGDCRDP